MKPILTQKSTEHQTIATCIFSCYYVCKLFHFSENMGRNYHAKRVCSTWKNESLRDFKGNGARGALKRTNGLFILRRKHVMRIAYMHRMHVALVMHIAHSNSRESTIGTSTTTLSLLEAQNLSK